MTNDERKAIQAEIDSLPKGSITYKQNGKYRYAYYQWTENGKQRNRRVKGEELGVLSELTERRKSLEKKLKESSRGMESKASDYIASVIKGSDLNRFVQSVAGWKKRECFSVLREYIYGDIADRVLILYGLRRTGKTTMIRQLIGEMTEETMQQTAFIQVNGKNDLSQINQDLKKLQAAGYLYIFLDEVTLMEDFIQGAALFSDVYAASGMKIVLSGTDSLGFMFSEDEELYDRCLMLHTTFIP